MGRVSYIIRCYDAGGLTTDFTNGQISSLYIRRRMSEGGYGVGRLCRSVLSCEIPDYLLDLNGRIDVFCMLEQGTYELMGSFFVSERARCGGRLKVKAEDCLSRLEQPFTPLLTDGTSSIGMTEAVFEIGRLCGVEIDQSAVSFMGYVFPAVPRCSCRRALEYCCSAVGANAYTGGGMQIILRPTMSLTAFSSASDAHSSTNPSSGFEAHVQVLLTTREADINSTLHIPYAEEERAELLRQGIFFYPHDIQASDRYLLHAVCPAATAEMCAALYTAVQGKQFAGLGFDCKTAAADCDILPGTQIVFAEEDGYFVASEVRLRLSGAGVFAELSAELRTEEEFPRLGRIEAELLRRTEENAIYKDVCLDRSGLNFYREGGSGGEKSSVGGLSVRDDYGIAVPEPIAEPTPARVVDVEDSITDIYYTDYKIRMVFSETETGETYTTEVIPL